MKHLWKLTIPVYIIVVLPMIVIRAYEIIVKGFYLYTFDENKWNKWLFAWYDKIWFDDNN